MAGNEPNPKSYSINWDKVNNWKELKEVLRFLYPGEAESIFPPSAYMRQTIQEVPSEERN